MKATTFLILLAVPYATRALDLTPERTSRELEGVKIPILRFANGEHRVSYQPPANWQISGGGAKLSLYPPGRTESVVKLQIFPRKPLPSGVMETFDDLKKWALEFLPQDAADVSLITASENPFTLGELGSQEFIFTYLQQKHRFIRSIAIVNLDPRQRLALTVFARAGDFETVHGEAIASMFSWQ